jgi:hypothetical protein
MAEEVWLGVRFALQMSHYSENFRLLSADRAVGARFVSGGGGAAGYRQCRPQAHTQPLVAGLRVLFGWPGFCFSPKEQGSFRWLGHSKLKDVEEQVGLLGAEYEHEPVPVDVRRSLFSMTLVWARLPDEHHRAMTGSTLVLGMFHPRLDGRDHRQPYHAWLFRRLGPAWHATRRETFAVLFGGCPGGRERCSAILYGAVVHGGRRGRPLGAFCCRQAGRANCLRMTNGARWSPARLHGGS